MRRLMKKMAVLAAAGFAAFGALFNSFLTPIVYAEESGTVSVSDVMTDLKKDATFSEENYPEKTIEELDADSEEYLQIIRIGESVNDGLYIYIYQASDSTKELEATQILLGRSTNESSAHVYPLELVSTKGVFDKYLVKGFTTLKDFSVREYQITTLYRSFDSDLDKQEEIGGKDTYIAIPVAQTWYARNGADGNIEYGYTCDEVITITDEWHGDILYADGITADGLDFKKAFTTSHVVAFTTDKKMEKLKSAEIYFNEYDYEYHFCPSCAGVITSGDLLNGTAVIHDGYVLKKEGTNKPNHIKVEEKQTGGNSAEGWFSQSYSWKRILTVERFLETEKSLSSSAVERLTNIESNANGNGAFVLRFYETNYTWDPDGGKNHALTSGARPHIGNADLYKGTKIKDISILKLTFVADGITYAMGVVDSMTTSDDIVDGSYLDTTENLLKKIEQVFQAIGIMVGAIALGFIIYFLVLAISKLVAFIKSHPINFGGGGSGGGSGGDNNKTDGNAG